MNIYLEIFGYIGTVLVIISMMMTSFLKFRVINMCGGLISFAYAVFTETWPVALLNVCLICINFVQTMRQLRKNDKFAFSETSASDGAFKYFISYFKDDVEKFTDNVVSVLNENDSVYLIFSASRIVGFIAGEKNEARYNVKMCYVIPENRDNDILKSLFAYLKKEGIDTLCTDGEVNTFVFANGSNVKNI